MNSILEQFIEASKLQPDKDAVVLNNVSVTYGELSRKAQLVSYQLKEMGVLPGDRVCLLIKNSAEYVIAYYAIWMAGAVVVSLNTDLQAETLVNIIKHAECGILLADRSVKSVKGLEVVDKSFEVIDIHQLIDDVPADDNQQINIVSVSEDEMAAIIYTSGTTGEPKGVVLTHKNIVSNMASIKDYLPIRKEDRVLNVLPFYYSYGNSVLHTYLSSGATIFLENSMMFPKKIIDKIIEQKITSFYGVPSTYILLLNNSSVQQLRSSHLNYVAQAGGKMSVHTTRSLLGVLNDADLYVMYGQTEATARISYLDPDYLLKKMGSVGKAIKGVVIEIRSETGHQLAPGEEGELYVCGANIMREYWRNDDMTNTVLFDGWLKTGDIGYKDKDGFIFLSGRNSDMIKVSGHRISPLEIEEVMIQLEFIEEVAVIGVSDDISGQVPKAVIKAKNMDQANDRIIKAHCSKNLASYKIPKIIEYVDELPKTASGKIKRFML